MTIPEREVLWIIPDSKDPGHGIDGIGGQWGCETVPVAHGQILREEWRYWTSWGYLKVYLVPRWLNGAPYLQTTADGALGNNLLFLPRQSWAAWHVIQEQRAAFWRMMFRPRPTRPTTLTNYFGNR
jgi:hypothetical protein